MSRLWTGFRSVFADGMQAFLAYKRALGRQYRAEESALRLFGRFRGEHHIATVAEVTPATVPNRSNSCRRRTCSEASNRSVSSIGVRLRPLYAADRLAGLCGSDGRCNCSLSACPSPSTPSRSQAARRAAGCAVRRRRRARVALFAVDDSPPLAGRCLPGAAVARRRQEAPVQPGRVRGVVGPHGRARF